MWTVDRASWHVCSHSQSVFISSGERHGIIQRCRLLEFNICFQRITKAGRENINLLLLREAGAAVDKRQKLTLIIGDCCLSLQLDHLAQHVAAEGWPKLLINQLDEGYPIWRPMIVLDEGIPLCRITCHVERGQEHFASLLGALDMEELLTPIQPRQWIFSAIISGEQQLVAMASRRDGWVTAGLWLPVITDDDLLLLQPINGHRQLVLVSLHGGQRRCHVINHRLKVGNLLGHRFG
jgi:hypothetical protein